MTSIVRPKAVTSWMRSSKIAEASRVHDFKLKILTRPMDLAQSLEEIPLISSDDKLQSNIKQHKEVAQRTTPIK